MSKRLSLEDKISSLTRLHEAGLNFDEIPEDYISEDNIIVNNVITNLKKAYTKEKLSISQITACEGMGIKFDNSVGDTNKEIAFLMHAKQEGTNFGDFCYGDNADEKYSAYCYIKDLRDKYSKGELTEEQVNVCANDFKIIIEKDRINDILKEQIRNSAYKNITYYPQIKNLF